MKQLKTKAIVLTRVNYSEADRIITVISHDYGKVRLIARGVRNLKSKLAGGIELFSVNDISFIQGKGEISTLVSSRLNQNFSNIIKNLDRVQCGYDFLKTIDRTTEDDTGSEYFDLLESALAGLNDPNISQESLKLWFISRLIAVSGHAPNLTTDKEGVVLNDELRYGFDSEAMCFFAQQSGRYSPNDVKYLRIAFNSSGPSTLARVDGSSEFALKLMPLVNTMRSTHLFG